MSYIEFKVPQQADQDLLIAVSNSDGSPFDLTACLNCLVILYTENKTIVAKYSVVTSTGWHPLVIGAACSNQLSFTLQSADSNLAPLSKVFAEIRTQTTDADVSDGKYDIIMNGIYVCTIVESLTSGLTLP